MYKVLVIATLVNPINITYCLDSACKTLCKTLIQENHCYDYNNNSLSYNNSFLTYYNDESCVNQNSTISPLIADGSCNKNQVGSYTVEIKQNTINDTLPGFLIGGLLILTVLIYGIYISSKRHTELEKKKPDYNSAKLPIFSD